MFMSNLYTRIEKLCKERNINITTMCKDSGASRGSLSDLKFGRKQSLSVDTLTKIASYFDISVDALLGEEEKVKSPDELLLTEGERKLIELFRKVPVDRRELVYQMIDAALSSL
jgi:transcriptional regulator with XRE-family HTH domain